MLKKHFVLKNIIIEKTKKTWFYTKEAVNETYITQ